MAELPPKSNNSNNNNNNSNNIDRLTIESDEEGETSDSSSKDSHWKRRNLDPSLPGDDSGGPPQPTTNVDPPEHPTITKFFTPSASSEQNLDQGGGLGTPVVETPAPPVVRRRHRKGPSRFTPEGAPSGGTPPPPGRPIWRHPSPCGRPEGGTLTLPGRPQQRHPI